MPLGFVHTLIDQGEGKESKRRKRDVVDKRKAEVGILAPRHPIRDRPPRVRSQHPSHMREVPGGCPGLCMGIFDLSKVHSSSFSHSLLCLGYYRVLRFDIIHIYATPLPLSYSSVSLSTFTCPLCHVSSHSAVIETRQPTLTVAGRTSSIQQEGHRRNRPFTTIDPIQERSL